VNVREEIDIVREPRGSIYRSLIRAAAGIGSWALVVVRDGPPGLTKAGEAVLTELQRWQRGVSRRAEWPGTRLLGDCATVYEFELAYPCVEFLCEAVSGLYEWQQPERPEDLCILRSDDEPVLVTIAHEHDGYLQVSRDELEVILADAPALASVLAI
jgi:hypothetical protein